MKTATTEAEKELLEALHDLVAQVCYSHTDKELDSMAMTSYAGPMKLLAEYGVITITHEYGRRVIAKDEPQEGYKP